MSVNFDEIKAFIANSSAKLKEKMNTTAKNFGKPYSDYDINVTASHYTEPESEPVFTRSYKGKFKIRLVDMAIAATLLALMLSLVRSVRNSID